MAMTYGLAGLAIALAYLMGSIPSGYWAGRWLKAIDIREQGSGSTGATNVLRTLGPVPAIAVLAIDILKGALAVALVGWWADRGYIPEPWQAWLEVAAGIAVVLGHSKSIFLKFTGGKSVATTLGVLLVLNLWVALGTLGSFGLTLALFKMVSLGSIVGAIAVNVLMLTLGQPLPYCLFAAVSGLYVIARHRANIQRILAGVEPKIGQKLPEEVSS